MFVLELTKLSEMVLFSSGTLLQTHKPHKNHQPNSYWRRIFRRYGYAPVDLIRSAFWEVQEIGPWYRQNTVLFIKNDLLQRDKKLFELQSRFNVIPADIYHPELLPPPLETNGVRTLMRALLKAVVRAFERRLHFKKWS